MTEKEILARAVRILERRAKYNTKSHTFSSPEHVRQYMKIHFAALIDGAEHFSVLYLDNRHRLIAAETPFHGTIDSAAVYPREIVKAALNHGAAAVIFGHNHPSGVGEPSDTDVRLTRKLTDALALIDIRVLDHLVVGDNSDSIVSLAERSLI